MKDHSSAPLSETHIELPCHGARSRGSVRIVRKEQVILSRRIRVALAQALVRSNCTFHCVRDAHARLAIADGNEQPLRFIRNRDVVVLKRIKLGCHRPHERVHREEDQVPHTTLR